MSDSKLSAIISDGNSYQDIRVLHSCCNWELYRIFMKATMLERKQFTCPNRESNPGPWIYRQTLYHIAVKASFYRNAVEVCYIPCPVTFSPTKLDFVPVIPGHRESFLMRLWELLPESRVGYLLWAPAGNRTQVTGSTGKHSTMSL